VGCVGGGGGGGVGDVRVLFYAHLISPSFFQRQSDVSPICAISFNGVTQPLFTAVQSVFFFALCLLIGSLRGRRRRGGKGENDHAKRVSVTRDG